MLAARPTAAASADDLRLLHIADRFVITDAVRIASAPFHHPTVTGQQRRVIAWHSLQSCFQRRRMNLLAETWQTKEAEKWPISHAEHPVLKTIRSNDRFLKKPSETERTTFSSDAAESTVTMWRIGSRPSES